MFMSDNGPPFLNSRTTLYDAGICLPLILKVPNGLSSKKNPNMVYYVDILPAILDWAGYEDIKKPGPQ